MTTTIKAIETVYRGHKFRSRLEARWAVFLTEMGIDFQYEPEGYQGFDLPNGKYLPDFFLPKYRAYLEGKPPPFAFPGWPKVYMAGRMKRESCYRPFDVETHLHKNSLAPVEPRRLLKAHIRYVGPYRDEGEHGVRRPRQHDADVLDEPSVIFRRSLDGIASCDIFFALFEDLEAYGTLNEIGYALAKRKAHYPWIYPKKAMGRRANSHP